MKKTNIQRQNQYYHAYQQFVQYYNQLNFLAPTSVILLVLPNFITICDLLAKLNYQNNFINNIINLGITSTLQKLLIQNSILGTILVIFMFLIELTPLASLILIVKESYGKKLQQNGSYKQRFQQWSITQAMRTYYSVFVFVGLPIFTSFGSKITDINFTYLAYGVIIIAFALANLFISQYHTFQLNNNFNQKTIALTSKNYPYKFIDSILIAVCIISINLSSGLLAQVLGFGFTLLRLILANNFPYYDKYHQKMTIMILIGSLVASIGFVIAVFSQQTSMIIAMIAILIIILNQTKLKYYQIYERVTQLQQNQNSIQAIRQRLHNDGLFARCFRQLILLSRKNNSHRNQLQIQILKSKCVSIQKKIRGVIKSSGAGQVIQFQHNIMQFIANFLQACEYATSVLRFMQTRDGKKLILASAIQHIMQLLIQNKKIIKRLVEINQNSYEIKILLLKTYSLLYKDNAYLRQIQKLITETKNIINNHTLNNKLFSDRTVVFFLNILQEVGKIMSVSKNLPTVLGYQTINLLGLSINQIIPLSIKPFHDQHLLNFSANVSSKQPKKNNSIRFFCYNNDFNLQLINVTYNWIMHDFSAFRLAGIMEKLQTNQEVILLNQFGNLQGWTKKIGNQELCLDDLSLNQRRNYNILPIFPSLVKYMDGLGVCVRTLLFKTARYKDSRLLMPDLNVSIATPPSNQDIKDLQKRLVATFNSMTKNQQIIGAFFVQLQFMRVTFCHGKCRMWQITIRSMQHVQNITQILMMIQKSQKKQNNLQQQTHQQKTQNHLQKSQGSQKQQMSVFSQDQVTDKKFDSNFGLNAEGVHVIPLQKIVFDQFHANSRVSFQLANVSQNTNKRLKLEKQQKMAASVSGQTNFNPNLQRSSSLFWYVILLLILFMTLVVYNIIAVISTKSLMNQEAKNIIKRNKAASIFYKSFFNPNITYVGMFANGSLLDNSAYLVNQQFQFKTFLGDKRIENKYYLFNTQIPAMLQRLTIPVISSSLPTIPPANQQYYSQLKNNYVGLFKQFDQKFTKSYDVWSSLVSSVKQNFVIRITFASLCSLFFALLLILLYYRQIKQWQTLEAFFKFQKQDLQKKCQTIGILVKEIQSNVASWGLLKQFIQTVNSLRISNFQFNIINNPIDFKIKFDTSQEQQKKLQNKQFSTAILFIVFFVFIQFLFLLAHSLITVNALNYYLKAPKQLDNAAKLIVYPNVILADLYLPISLDIINNYKSIVEKVLIYPLDTVSGFYPMLSEAPCTNCSYYRPNLATNFRSFYTKFEQDISDFKSKGTLNNQAIKQIFFAVDIVSSKIIEALSINDYLYLQISLLIFAVSMIILANAIYKGGNTINGQIQKLELFLGFFSQQTITKNKHMNRLFSTT